MSKFKVGDKVREIAIDGNLVDIHEHWNRYWAYKEGPAKDGVFTITRIIGNDYYEYSNKIGGSGPQAGGKYFELVEPATQTSHPSFIKTVPARREIIAGKVNLSNFANFEITEVRKSEVDFRMPLFSYSAASLRELISHLETIASVLEENSNAS